MIDAAAEIMATSTPVFISQSFPNEVDAPYFLAPEEPNVYSNVPLELLKLRRSAMFVTFRSYGAKTGETVVRFYKHFVPPALRHRVPRRHPMSSCNQSGPASACRISSTHRLGRRRWVFERSSSATRLGGHRSSCPLSRARRSAVMLPYPLT